VRLPKNKVTNKRFDADCVRCPRLVQFRRETRSRYPGYHCAPVSAFGSPDAELLVVGLAPGLHGANATGRPFTGDHAGEMLYATLFDYGFANRRYSMCSGDGLALVNCRITNAVQCLPPANKPTALEVATCNVYLQADIAESPGLRVIVALGAIAHGAVLRACGRRGAQYPFRHGSTHRLDTARWLVDSYHCSRYNTQTGRLTKSMFNDVFECARTLLAQ